ncbi:hypothetical protein, partial [Burkholderia sp. LMG 13014]|uniref:hypothetical protein n=1 Tax=Burkholderia sp. LMG 13014 TaxID=2709306 RepID=UPI001F057061
MEVPKILEFPVAWKLAKKSCFGHANRPAPPTLRFYPMSIASLRRPASPPAHAYRDFLAALQAAGFAGEIRADHANRTVQATDNSIYQRLPQAVICPAHADDVRLLARL